jgi:hypothetical protein
MSVPQPEGRVPCHCDKGVMWDETTCQGARGQGSCDHDETIALDQISGNECAWANCERVAPFPLARGWCWLVMHSSPVPLQDLMAIPPRYYLRDAVLCPTHARQLDRELLKILPRHLEEPAGRA